MKAKLAGAALSAVFTLSATPQAVAYPIDCAIILCLAGGFPASAECSAAKAEVIRRITPIPVEPPLQLWNCPMGSKDIPVPGMGADGLTPDVRKYRDAIELYHVQTYYRKRGGDSEYIQDYTQQGQYAEDGSFRWVGSSYRNGPAWLAEAAGGTTRTYVQGCDPDRPSHWDPCEGETISENDHDGRLRGVFIRYQDYSGAYHVEAVRY